MFDRAVELIAYDTISPVVKNIIKTVPGSPHEAGLLDSCFVSTTKLQLPLLEQLAQGGKSTFGTGLFWK